MGKLKKTSTSVNKHKDKRQARKLEQRRIADATLLVTAANKIKDVSSLCKDLLTFCNDNLKVDIYIKKVTELDKTVLEWAIDLTERNMKKLYETCVWGWNKNKKVEEMSEDAALYLIAKSSSGTQLAFSHFRFDMDYGDPVLYCYEVQVEAEGRRQGLGQHILAVLERLARETHMSCVRLTALTHNPGATAFFMTCGYTLDETSPDKDEASHYEILSKQTCDDGTKSECTLSDSLQALQVAPTN